MAGSYNHCVNSAGELLRSPMLDDLGDAIEAIEEMYLMIQVLSGGEQTRIEAARLQAIEMYRTLESRYAPDEEED